MYTVITRRPACRAARGRLIEKVVRSGGGDGGGGSGGGGGGGGGSGGGGAGASMSFTPLHSTADRSRQIERWCDGLV
ncbi:hypothetical protein EAI_01450 [Harpegnathos saltator]|uniref:Uncharacterized protein n=1 Tax=Harpegnathos saltator TaxID=610380 RepID=E2BMG4_HARSA|nr:hypothetical protein EAI_01450 [Harpegnathos saltator]